MNKVNKKFISLMVVLSLVFSLGIFAVVNAMMFEGTPDEMKEMLSCDCEEMVGGQFHTRLEDFSEGISVDGTVVIDGDGNIDAPITSTTGTFSSTLSVTGDTTLSSALAVSGETSVEGFTDGAGALQVATSSTDTGYLTQAQLLADNYIEIMVNTGATKTITLPATTTLTTLIPNEGDHRNWIIHNATSSTMALTIAAGTGIDLIGVTTNDDVIDATEYSELECWRQPGGGDVTCRISELLHVD